MRHPGRALFVVLFFGLLSGCTPLDRRSTSTSFEDREMENQAISRINSRHFGLIHVNVTSFNRHLLLSGEVPNENLRTEIEKVVSGVPNVQGVSNELIVGEIHGIASQSADSLINSDVKMRFARKGNFDMGRVKVVTENGTVFLMGLVYKREAASAADLASTTKGVQRVVTIFEYMD